MAFRLDKNIEFIGGPLDGHLDTIDAPLAPLLGVKNVSSAESRSLVASVSRLLRDQKQPVAFLVAVYELDGLSLGVCYRYRGTHVLIPTSMNGMGSEGDRRSLY